MKQFSGRILEAFLVLVSLAPAPAGAVELKISRDVLQRTLKQQLFSGPNGRYYLTGNEKTPCYVYADDAQLSFVQDRVLVVIKTHAKLGKSFGSSCLGVTFNTDPQVSLEPQGEKEIIGFRDARLEKVLDQKEFNYLLTPFLSKQLPSNMQMNAGDLLRKALQDSTSTTGFKITLDRLKIHSMMIDGDSLVLDVDGDLSVK